METGNPKDSFLDKPALYKPHGPPAYAGYVVAAAPAEDGNRPQQHGQAVYYDPTGATIVGRRLPPDHMTAAVLVTICCFFPTGLFAVLKASEARSAMARGDYEAAERHAKTAKRLINASIVAGVILTIIAIVFVVIFLVLLSKKLQRF